MVVIRVAVVELMRLSPVLRFVFVTGRMASAVAIPLVELAVIVATVVAVAVVVAAIVAVVVVVAVVGAVAAASAVVVAMRFLPET